VNEQHFDFEDQHLEPAWQALEQRMRSAELVKPRAGFSRRWLARYNAQPSEDQRNRSLLLGFANAGATLILFAMLLPSLSPWLSQPGSVLAGVADWVFKLTATVLAVVRTFESVASVIPAAAWLVIGSSSLALLLVSALLFSKVDWIKGEMK
jgi:hypothetical protein